MSGSVALVTGLLLVFYFLIRSSMIEKSARRLDLKESFARFIVDNRTAQISTEAIEQFLESTQDAKTVFSSFGILHLRRELYDNANGMIHLRSILDDENTNASNRRKAAAHLQVQQDWFARRAVKLDSIFAPELIVKPNASDVVLETFRLIGRAIRA